jgi:hypothetical protein
MGNRPARRLPTGPSATTPRCAPLLSATGAISITKIARPARVAQAPSGRGRTLPAARAALRRPRRSSAQADTVPTCAQREPELTERCSAAVEISCLGACRSQQRALLRGQTLHMHAQGRAAGSRKLLRAVIHAQRDCMRSRWPRGRRSCRSAWPCGSPSCRHRLSGAPTSRPPPARGARSSRGRPRPRGTAFP